MCWHAVRDDVPTSYVAIILDAIRLKLLKEFQVFIHSALSVFSQLKERGSSVPTLRRTSNEVGRGRVQAFVVEQSVPTYMGLTLFTFSATLMGFEGLHLVNRMIWEVTAGQRLTDVFVSPRGSPTCTTDTRPQRALLIRVVSSLKINLNNLCSL